MPKPGRSFCGWPIPITWAQHRTALTGASSCPSCPRFLFTRPPLLTIVRASFFLKKLPEPKNEREAIAGILAIARNASVPFGAPNYAPGTLYNTEYRTALDLTNRRYFFELTTSPNVVWVDLARFNLAPGAPVKALDPDNIELAGNVSSRFRAAKAPF